MYKRTKFPKVLVTLNGRVLSQDEIDEFTALYKPPLTLAERVAKQDMMLGPDNSTSDGLY